MASNSDGNPLENARRIFFYDWADNLYEMDEEYTRKFLKLSKLREEVLLEVNDCCWTNDGKTVEGSLKILGSKEIVFSYQAGFFFFKKEKSQSIRYDDIISISIRDARTVDILIRSQLYQNGEDTHTYTFSSGMADEFVKQFEEIPTPEYVDIPKNIRTIRLVY